MFSSAAVAVTATPPICKAVDALIVGPVTVPVNVGLATGALVSICVCTLDVTPSTWLSSAVVAVTPSMRFNSVAVAVTPSSMLSSDAVAVTPVNSAGATAPSASIFPVATKFAKSLGLPILFILYLRWLCRPIVIT